MDDPASDDSKCPASDDSKRMPTLDCLRGIASFAVAWFHFTNGNPAFLPAGWLKASGTWGWLGVQMFFVISGFVIPYSLYKSRYSLKNFSRFLVKRVSRLDPPYVAGIFLVVAMAYLSATSSSFRGARPHFTFSQLALHLGYLNSVAGKPWVNPVFWSLGVEFQYYLLIGCMFPLLVDRRLTVRMGALAALLMPGMFIPKDAFVFVHLPFFVLGILVFQRKIGLVPQQWFAALAILAAALAWVRSGPEAVSVGVITAAFIAWVNIGNRILAGLGLISYSLYLVHVPIGGRVINLGTRFAHSLPSQCLVLAGAVAASIISSFLMYLAVERPSQRLSACITYRTRQTASGSAFKVAASASPQS
jgi:peptidoglycan/LPS O-acetylase OafA/YrhL